MRRPIGRLTKPLQMRRSNQSRIDRMQSPLKMQAIPIASVLLGCVVTVIPFISTQAILPPFGLMIFLAWRLMRPGLWPMWAGMPFGVCDDMFSGQPFGSAALIWSAIMIGLELLDTRAIWRDYLQDWLIASVVLILALCTGLFFVGLAYARPAMITLLPQILISILLYPMVMRLCAWLDKWRLST
jgi:rod shape-determining protein MreD